MNHNYQNELFKIAFEHAIYFEPLNEYVRDLNGPKMQALMRVMVSKTMDEHPTCHKTHDEGEPNKYGVRVSGPMIAVVFSSCLTLNECREIYHERQKEAIRKEIKVLTDHGDVTPARRIRL